MTCRVDAHFHIWQYSSAEYGWIDNAMRALHRDFLPEDLRQEMSGAGVSAAIAVQARQCIEETLWLISLAHQHPFIAGVVGWAPIASADFPGQVEALASDAALKGLRHVLQDEADDAYMLRQDFNRGISAMQGTSLAYDILILERQLPFAAQFVDRHPSQVFVLDHMAKPKIGAAEISPWKEHLRELARRPNVWCKVSGMVTEAAWQNWNVNDLHPYIEIALECFGPQRLLAGSDWPVCTVASSYRRWWQTLDEFVSSLTVREQQAILGGNAVQVYRLDIA